MVEANNGERQKDLTFWLEPLSKWPAAVDYLIFFPQILPTKWPADRK